MRAQRALIFAAKLLAPSNHDTGITTELFSDGCLRILIIRVEDYFMEESIYLFIPSFALHPLSITRR
jgi:hypothetical protein